MDITLNKLKFPKHAVVQKFAFMGISGSGKTYGAGVFTEKLLADREQVVIVDPVGVWWALRLAANGKSPGIKILVLGGEHGDIPLEATAGAVIADFVVDQNASVVLDISEFTGAETNRFVADFALQLLKRKKRRRSALMIVWDECQDVVPQNPDPEQKRVKGAMTKLVKVGRNFGIGTTLISQRPQAVSKEVLNQTECLLVFQLNASHERKAIEAWVVNQGLDQSVLDELPTLPTGVAYLWSPRWLGVFKKVKIAKKWTFDASATPTGSGRRQKTRDLAQIDLDKVKKAMAATVEKMKESDPSLLRAENAKLRLETKKLERDLENIRAHNKIKAQVTAVPAKTVKAPKPPKQIKVPIVKKAQINKLHKLVERLDTLAERTAEMAKRFSERITKTLHSVNTSTQHPAPLVTAASTKSNPIVIATLPVDRDLARTARKYPKVQKPDAPSGDSKVSKPQQRMLDTLAWLESIGRTEATKTQLALMSDQSPTSGGYFNNLSALRSQNLVSYPQSGHVALTDAGRALAVVLDTPMTTAALHAQIFQKVSGPQRRMLETLIQYYPASVEKDDLAAQSGQSATSGGYFNNLSTLRSLGVIDYPTKGHAVALPVLFLDR